ncbi:MAG: c-type cytochrome [Gemmatimonadales bacterium]|nr:c-type cytochrome [Gemmatimonadales bacterium]
MATLLIVTLLVACATARRPIRSAFTRASVAQGDSIFHGQVAGGTCAECHGPNARGTAAAPNLVDGEWQNGDGSYEFIVRTVTTGVPPHPEHGRAGMPAMGGVRLTSEQVRSVAAYVYTRSRPGR